MITTQVTNVSEVAALRISIALECEALERAMHGTAIVANQPPLTNATTSLLTGTAVNLLSLLVSSKQTLRP